MKAKAIFSAAIFTMAVFSPFAKENTKAASYKTHEVANGFDLQDADGYMTLPVKGGGRLKENYVGTHFKDYDAIQPRQSLTCTTLESLRALTR